MNWGRATNQLAGARLVYGDATTVGMETLQNQL
jgi:hypothetical protein